MTKIINLYGGPGTGKSTAAAYLYWFLKNRGENAELVREYVKDWAWEGRKIGPYDQLYFLSKQTRRETLMYGKVTHIVTDSPVMLGAYYASRYSPPDIAQSVLHSVQGFYRQAAKDGHQHLHVFLKRTKAYNQAGRFESEAEALQIDDEMQKFLTEQGVAYSLSGTSPAELQSIFT